VPLSTQVALSTPDVIHVVEASSFQLETTEQFRPWIAVLLNLSADHLDRHESLEEYAAAKGRIFANQQAGDVAIVNVDDPPSKALARTLARIVPLSPSASIADGIVVTDDAIAHRLGGVDTTLVPVSAVRLLGRHLLTDVAAAAAVAEIAGVDPEAMVRAVEGFTGLEHALEPVSSIQGVGFVNDSKATNIESAARAIESIDQGLVVIMGGRFKGGRFEDLKPLLPGRVDAIVSIGEARPLIRSAFEGVVPLREAESMPAAVRAAVDAAAPGGTVLLAPACSSFDMFRDYAERGRSFKAEVFRLAGEREPHR
jgi:UDP-N-acetylmuramoylalanine--D-glutamate ligase